jgi:hypothetical protein
MEIVITRTKTGCVATIDGKEVARAKTLAAIHKAIKAHLAGNAPEPEDDA